MIVLKYQNQILSVEPNQRYCFLIDLVERQHYYFEMDFLDVGYQAPCIAYLALNGLAVSTKNNYSSTLNGKRNFYMWDSRLSKTQEAIMEWPLHFSNVYELILENPQNVSVNLMVNVI